MSILRRIMPADRNVLEKILRGTRVFKDEEISVALELIDIAIKNPDQDDYFFKVAVSDTGIVQGYYCIGPTPLTKGTYDLYWIVVDAEYHNRGVGSLLMKDAESWVSNNGGNLIIVETSSQSKYDNTRNFYLRTKYEQVARIKDYYSAGDDLLIYGKYVSQYEV